MGSRSASVVIGGASARHLRLVGGHAGQPSRDTDADWFERGVGYVAVALSVIWALLVARLAMHVDAHEAVGTPANLAVALVLAAPVFAQESLRDAVRRLARQVTCMT